MSAAEAGSPADDLRAEYETRQAAQAAQHVDVWESGGLVAEVRRPAGVAGARGALRTLASLAAADGELDVTADDLASMIAAATVGLHKRGADGTLTPRLDAAGQPLRFGQELSARLGYPEVTTPRDSVLLAFTEGEPPDVNTVRLMLCASNVAGVLISGRVVDDEIAGAVVGEASALRS